jgi:L-asparaginase/N4-(beta-N-acetylglucosaminyl)-L-asparaginase
LQVFRFTDTLDTLFTYLINSTVMYTRRNFLQTSFAGTLGVSIIDRFPESLTSLLQGLDPPIVISTWEHGLKANETAWKILSEGGSALDSVEQGVRVSEADPEVTSVGYGGFPDSSGHVTLDACIMDEKGNAGSVAYLRNIKHPVSVARMVMERTPHVMLTGEGALEFALSQGFRQENLMTPASRTAWKEWLKTRKPYPVKARNHDTIGMLALDKSGNLSGACTTSGIAFKMPGRVGDSPIIGAGLYVDNEVGAAAATGQGELILKIVGSFLIVELMRNGMPPENACREAVLRISRKLNPEPPLQAGFIALNREGRIGGFSLRKGFNYALYRNGKNELIDANWLV